MNDRQENRLGMFRSTGQLLTENAATFAAVPAMVTQHQNLLDSIALIDSLAQAQTAVTTGVTVDKRTFQDQMVSYGLRVAGAVKAYASTAGNATLRDKADINPSDFTHVRDDQRDDIAQGAHDDANGVIASLADYGVTAATLSALQTRSGLKGNPDEDACSSPWPGRQTHSQDVLNKHHTRRRRGSSRSWGGELRSCEGRLHTC